jgi:hypothetical protein
MDTKSSLYWAGALWTVALGERSLSVSTISEWTSAEEEASNVMRWA